MRIIMYRLPYVLIGAKSAILKTEDFWGYAKDLLG